jgi:transcriptional regulator with XRE-family HTH domain
VVRVAVNSGISKPVQAESGGEPDAEEHSGPIDKHLGKRVRMRRLMLRMSQTELGEALDLTFQQVQKYEKGENRIGASRLQHISEVLGVPIVFFFEGAPHNRRQQNAQTAALSPKSVADCLSTVDGIKLTSAFMQIRDAKVRRSIVSLVEGIASHTNSGSSS